MRPLADWARIGAVPRPWVAICTRIREAVAALMEAGFSGPFLTADSRPFHEAGATEAQEIASLIAQGITYLRLLGKGGIGPEKAQTLISFTPRGGSGPVPDARENPRFPPPLGGRSGALRHQEARAGADPR